MTPGRLRRNIAYNLTGQGIPFAVALVAMPWVTRGLGPDRFGVLALAWTFIGYFTVFDLGLGRSLTQRLAELLGEGRSRDVPALAWTGFTATFLLGLVGSGALVLVARPLVHSVLEIPPDLTAESLRALQILGLSLPFMLSTNALRGVLEAYHRFGLVTAVRAPLGALMFLAPALALPFTSRLDIIVTLLVATRVAGFLVQAALCVHVDARLARPRWPRWRGAKALLRMGGWLTVSNVISPVLVYADRFLIGSLASMSAVAFYATPSEVVSRVVAGPVAIAGVFFPAFASTFRTDPDGTAKMFSTSVRVVLLLLFPILLGIVVFAEVGLRAWLGVDFAVNGAAVARWLALGVLFNGLAQVPLALVHGAARADITARMHAWEAPIYLVVLWFLVQTLGPVGAAMAWSLRAAVDAGLLLLATARIVAETRSAVAQTAMWTALAAILLGLGWGLVDLQLPMLAFVLPLGLYGVAAWQSLLRPEWKARWVPGATG